MEGKKWDGKGARKIQNKARKEREKKSEWVKELNCYTDPSGGRRRRSWLTHCTALQVGSCRLLIPTASLELFIDIILPVTLCPWGRLRLFNKNKYQGYLLRCKGDGCVGLTTLPPWWDDCLEIWEPQSPGIPRAYQGLCRDCFTCF